MLALGLEYQILQPSALFLFNSTKKKSLKTSLGKRTVSAFICPVIINQSNVLLRIVTQTSQPSLLFLQLNLQEFCHCYCNTINASWWVMIFFKPNVMHIWQQHDLWHDLHCCVENKSESIIGIPMMTVSLLC